jgi:flavin-binding protein dodecin
MYEAHLNPYDALRGAAYGIVEGTGETGMDLARAATEAIAGARETARTLHLKEEEATQQVVRGVLEACQTLGPQAVGLIKKTLPHELIAESSAPQKEKDLYKPPSDEAV